MALIEQPSAGVGATPSLCQIDNLLRFLNQIDTPGELVAVVDAREMPEIRQVAVGLLELRSEIGAFITLADLETVAPLDGPIAQALLGAARHALFTPALRAAHAPGLAMP